MEFRKLNDKKLVDYIMSAIYICKLLIVKIVLIMACFLSRVEKKYGLPECSDGDVVNI